jgi:hypothetical protein
MLFQKDQPVVPIIPDLTSEGATIIYNALKNGLTETDIFKQLNIPFEHSTQVVNEIQLLESLVLSTLLPETKEELLSTLSSDLLNVVTVLDDIIKYNPSFDESRTYEQFLLTYHVE